MGAPTISLRAVCLAEAIGTFILVFLGCGAVHVAVLTGQLSGLWQVAIVWGVAVMLAIYVVGGISGSHINPAITIAFAVWGRFEWRRVVPYILSQVAGAFLAAAMLFAVYGSFLLAKEAELGVSRGEPGSEGTAMCYGEFFPNPSLPGNVEEFQARNIEALRQSVTEMTAVGIEILGTLLLALVVFAVTDERNAAAPAGRMAPLFIGLTVAVLIVVVAPLTQACFNPARDFGPRLFTAVAGWGTIALPGQRSTGFFTVYILAPIIGAVLGGGLYVGFLRPALVPATDEGAAA